MKYSIVYICSIYTIYIIHIFICTLYIHIYIIYIHIPHICTSFPTVRHALCTAGIFITHVVWGALTTRYPPSQVHHRDDREGFQGRCELLGLGMVPRGGSLLVSFYPWDRSRNSWGEIFGVFSSSLWRGGKIASQKQGTRLYIMLKYLFIYIYNNSFTNSYCKSLYIDMSQIHDECMYTDKIWYIYTYTYNYQNTYGKVLVY